MLTPLRTRLHHLTLWWHQHHPAATTWNTFYIQELFVVLLALGTGIYSAPEFSMDYISPPLTFSLLAPHLLLATLAFLLTTAPRHPLFIRLLNAALFLHPIGEYLAIPVMLVTLWYGFFVPRPTSCPKTRNPAVYFAYHPALFLITAFYGIQMCIVILPVMPNSIEVLLSVSLLLSVACIYWGYFYGTYRAGFFIALVLFAQYVMPLPMLLLLFHSTFVFLGGAFTTMGIAGIVISLRDAIEALFIR